MNPGTAPRPVPEQVTCVGDMQRGAEAAARRA